VRCGGCSGCNEARRIRALAGVSASGEVGVGVLVELEGVLSFMDVEFDEFACRVLLEDDRGVVPAAAPEKGDVGAG
jgi:hypothetical protein